jgi:predicted Rossmann fold nucleotide-binding protein DprA/Smf involved in DNA uptake
MKIKKQLPALIAALLVTGFIALTMLVTSANALLNKNGTAVSNDPASISAAANVDQVQIDQLQARIDEYQQREAQYQQLLQQDRQQLQQYQQFVIAMQQAGLVQIRQDGTILINARRGGDDD